jgi:putative transposase
MLFEEGHLYHIYNQGNNRQKIFFSRENYLFFLRKIREYMLPHADVLAWCLMPNHFHLMVYVRKVEIEIENLSEGVAPGEDACVLIDGVTPSHPVNKNRKPDSPINKKKRILNDSIAILLRSYTRAINNQEGRSGALFREETKSLCLTTSAGLSPSYFNTAFGASIYIPAAEKEYPQICFNYIHQNPVMAGLVEKSEEWEFSSYPDYVGLRDGQLICRERAEEFVQVDFLFIRFIDGVTPSHPVNKSGLTPSHPVNKSGINKPKTLQYLNIIKSIHFNTIITYGK